MSSNSKYIIKIPDNIEILYHKQTNIVVVIGKLNRKILKFKNKIILNDVLKSVEITKDFFFLTSNISKKTTKSYQGTYLSLLKQSFLEVSLILYKKLKLVGIGYKVIIEKILDINFLILKLGYSHNIYFKIPTNINIMCLKSDKIFISGLSYKEITQLASILKSYKLPEPYKGKGILYDNEKILLKEGKKI